MFANDKVRNIVSFSYHVAALVAGLIVLAVGFNAPDYSASSTLMLGFALVSLGLSLFRFWHALDHSKFKKFLSIISFVAAIFSMFMCIGIAISHPHTLTSRPLWYGSFYMLVAIFVGYSIFGGVACDLNDAAFEFACYAVLLAPVVLFFIGILMEVLLAANAILLGIGLSIFLIASFFSGNPVNMVVSAVFVIFYGLLGCTSSKFMEGHYYGAVPVLILVAVILWAATAGHFTRNAPKSKKLDTYIIVVGVIIIAACFVLQQVILNKWWLGLLILLGVCALNALIFYEISHAMNRREMKRSGSSSGRASGGDAKTESLVRERLRTYVKSANYNAAKLGQYHITVSCTNVDCFITVSGDVQIDADIKFQATSYGALNNTSNLQMLVDAKNHVQDELYKNTKKALEVAVNQGAKLSGRYSVNANFDV